MKILTPYLIGQITANPITYQWREELRLYVNEFPQSLRDLIYLIDPCNNLFSQSMLDESVDNDLPEDFANNVSRSKQSRLFPAIDKAYVKKDSNACIFNANHYSPETPFLGTIFELAWYHDQPWKPVVGVFEGNPEKDYLCNHPFVQDTVHTWVRTPIEALNLLLSLQHK